MAGAVAMAVAMGLGRFYYTPILPAMMSGVPMGPTEAGYVASANYVGYLVGAVLAAYGWAEGMERRVALSGLLATALLLLSMSLTTNILAFSVIRFLAGVASALAMIFTSSLVLSFGLARGRPVVQSLHFGGVGLGIALSAVLFAAVVLFEGGWRGAWIAGGIAALGGCVLAAVLLPRQVSRTGPVRKEPPLVWTRPLVLLTVAYGLFGFGYIVTATFLVAIVREAGGSSTSEALVWLATGLAAAPSVALWGIFARRFGLVMTFVAGCMTEAIGVAASVLLPLPVGPMIGGVLLGLTFVMITAYGLQAGREYAGDSPRRAFALMTAAFGVGQIIGPVVAGNLAHFTGNYVLGSMSAVAALVLAAGLAIPLRRG
ncbi:YbfB/YjiJ family MFS transporter [Pseudohoeflea suaedae]|uniref:YbfB/YjiJ family MFS transporter n=2 Tax=Pseudohoeflea suaedae TaxID=877384 RepID=A0A4R5PQL5_9HYPH|nr:YbfB/YjiJ family MFS transporter [Pseudohoeflea suaedae]TDH39444.1 YbfB/YjiJ family MFS transporter [Pseudohoeflea suaedae]